jgi:hypothetical protein
MSKEAVINESFIESHIAKSARLIGKDRVLDHTPGCPDGRNTMHGWFDFGGDSAKRLRKIMAYERATGTVLNTNLVSRAIAVLSHNRPGIHLHFDDHLMHELTPQVVKDNRFQRVAKLSAEDDYQGMGRFLIDPNRLGLVEMERLAQIISEQRDVGCGHWSLLLNRSDEMGVREGLARDVYVANLLEAWAHPMFAQLPILHGKHDELAIVQVYSEEKGFVPLVQPNIDGVEVFVVTPQAIECADELAFPNVARVLGGDMKKKTYLRHLRDIAERQTNFTLANLGAAKGKEIYAAVVSRDMKVSARKLGVNG